METFNGENGIHIQFSRPLQKSGLSVEETLPSMNDNRTRERWAKDMEKRFSELRTKYEEVTTKAENLLEELELIIENTEEREMLEEANVNANAQKEELEDLIGNRLEPYNRFFSLLDDFINTIS